MIGIEAAGQVDDRRGSVSRLVPLERLLAGDQMVEVPDRDSASPEQFPGVPVKAGYVNQALAVAQASAHRLADPQPPFLEGEEPDDAAVAGEHGDPGVGPE